VNIDVEPELFIMTAFVESLRACLVANRYVDEKGLISLNGRVMVGYEGQLYIVSGDFSVMKSTHPFAAIGDGASVALGALAAIDLSRHHGAGKIQFALEIVEQFMTNVRAPFVIESIGVE
jgi:ATP-dependent protease HslVU (ClpYQ) peptidase subunit